MNHRPAELWPAMLPAASCLFGMLLRRTWQADKSITLVEGRPAGQAPMNTLNSRRLQQTECKDVWSP